MNRRSGPRGPWRYWPVPVVALALGGAALFVRSRPAAVSAAPVEAAPIAHEASGTGTIESESQVNVAFTLPGRLAKVPVQEGQRVRAGDVLAVLDAEEQGRHLDSARRGVDLAATSIQRAEADIQRARVTHEAAVRDRKRTDALFAAGVVSEAERDSVAERAERAEAELIAARAARQQGAGAVAVARAAVAVESHRTAETTVTSPVDGVVVRRLREPGDVVAAGVPVLSVASTRKVWARTWLDETVIHRLAEGQRARVVLRGDPGRSYAATVDRIAVEADRQTHEILVDLRLDEVPERLVFGQRADGVVTLATVEGRAP